MWTLKSSSEKRELQLLREVFLNDEIPSVSSLLERLNCDIKTLKSTIKQINNSNYAIPKLFMDVPSNLIMYKKDTNFFPTNFYFEFFKKSLEFQIMEYIFIHNDCTITDVADEFYISESTTIRVVKHIRDNVQKYHFDLHLNPLSFIGDEKVIRNFFIQYFYEKGSCEFYNDDRFDAFAFSIFKTFAYETNITLLQPFYGYMKWMVFVTMIRITAGFKYSTTDTLANNIQNPFRDKHRNKETYTNTFSNHDDAIFDDIKAFLSLSYNIKTSSTLISSKSIDTFLKRFENVFAIKITPEDADTFREYVSYFTIIFLNRTYFMHNRHAYRIKKMYQSFPKSTHDLFMLIHDFLLENNIDNIEATETLCSLYFDLIPNLFNLFENHEDKLLVNLYLVANDTQKETIIGLLEKRFSHLATFTAMDTNTLLTQDVIKEGLWITDITTLFGDNILSIKSALIYDEIIRIFDFLKQKSAQNLDPNFLEQRHY